MKILNNFLDLLQVISDKIPSFITEFLFSILIFLLLIILSFFGGRITIIFLRYLITLSPQILQDIYHKFLQKSENIVQIIITILYLILSLWTIENYLVLHQFLQFILYLALSIEIAWFLSRVSRQVIRDYIVEFNQSLGKGTDDIILILEFFINLLVGFFAVIIFAQSQNIDLSFVLTQVGISGVAIAFASKKVLEQLVGTIAIYLDRPYQIGDYIRVNFNIKAEDLYARVESIGIRSTKLRVVATNTLVIAPNSLMASKDIENISKGTKGMVLFQINFENQLLVSEQELVRQIIQSITHENFGVDPGSTFVETLSSQDNEGQVGTCLQVSLFMLVPNRYEMILYQETIESIRHLIAKELQTYQFHCEIQEQHLCLDSPVSL